MTSPIFLNPGRGLTRMERANYMSEQELQDLIARRPELLGSSTALRDGVERPLLLVKQEMPVERSTDGPGTWSIDHLYIDSEGIPVLVEVKRSTDSRVRRAVVGQLLDYAANAVVYWPVETMKQRLIAQWGERAEETLQSFLQPTEMTPEDFWQKVDANLRAKRVRLLFVADELPLELKRIIEFLNDQLRETEVLGLELPQLIGGGQQAIVPTLVGNTVQAASIKSGGVARTYPELDEVVAAFRRLTKGELRVNGGSSQHYRQIALDDSFRTAQIHYEFQWWAGRPKQGLPSKITCEFHVEQVFSDQWKTVMLGLQQPDAGLTFELRGEKGVLALATPSQDPEVVAQTMVDLMRQTQGELRLAGVRQ